MVQAAWDLRRRVWRVVALFVRLLVEVYLLEWQERLFGARRLAARRSRLYRRHAVRLREAAQELGGLLIKVGQAASSRVDILPPEFTEELAHLQDEVPPEAWPAVKATVEAELGRPLEEAFRHFDPAPVAAASLGQVHRAVLPDGTEVAVKVQRPGIEDVVAADLRALRLSMALARRLTRMGRELDLDRIFEEFRRTTAEELDYLAEARNAEQFAANFADRRHVRAPRVHWSHTTRRVLTMEYVRGIKITHYAELEAAGIDRSQVARRLIRAYLRQIFRDGFFHADPHPGNLFVQSDGTLVFVDFGMVGRIPAPVRAVLRDLLRASVEADPTAIVQAMDRLGFLRPGADRLALERTASLLLDRFHGRTLREWQETPLEEIGQQVLGVLRGNPFQVPQNFIYLGKTVGTLAGLATGLDPDFNLVAVVGPYLARLAEDPDGGGPGEVARELRRYACRLLRLPALTERVLTKAERGRLHVELDLTPFEQVSAQVEAAVRRGVLAVLAAGILVASALLYLNGAAWEARAGLALALVLAAVALRTPRRRRPGR